MSHFTKNTKVFISDTNAFVKACQELGIGSKSKTNTTIRGWGGRTTRVDFALEASAGKRFDIGLVKEGEDKYSMVADWMGVRGENPRFNSMNDEQVQGTILQHTAKHSIKDKYEAQGFDVSVVQDKAGDMQLTLTRQASRY